MTTAELRLFSSPASPASPAAPLESSSTPADVRPRRRFHVVPALAVLVLLPTGGTGCSLVFVDGPPPQHRTMPYFDCTSSHIAPVADFIVAGSEGLAAVGSYHDLGSSSSNREDLLGAAIIAAGFLTSGIVGIRRASECREAKAQLAVRSTENSRHGPGQALQGVPANNDPWLAPGPPAATGWRAPTPPPPTAPTSAPAAIGAPPPAGAPTIAPTVPTHPTPERATDDEDPRAAAGATH